MAMPHQHLTPLDPEFAHMATVLKESLIPDVGVPICLAERGNYFATATSTVLLALHHINAISKKEREAFYRTLFVMKGETTAWSAESSLEGPTVWATSLALWALLGTGFDDRLKMPEMRDAAMWLCQQKRPGDSTGWGYSSTKGNTAFTAFFTCFALHALKLVREHKELSLTPQQQSLVAQCIQSGVAFLRATGTWDGKKAYWGVPGVGGRERDATETICAIWALHEHGDDQDEALIDGGIRFLRSTLGKTKGNPLWEDRTIGIPPGSDGIPAAVIVSFPPSFLIPLLGIGCDPFDEICLAPLEWFERNRLPDGWPHLPGFMHDAEHAQSFTTAYGLWGIANWYRRTARRARLRANLMPDEAKQLRRRIGVLAFIVVAELVYIVLADTSALQLPRELRHLFAPLLPYSGLLETVGRVILASALTFVGRTLVRVFRPQLTWIGGAFRWMFRTVFVGNGRKYRPVRRPRRFGAA